MSEEKSIQERLRIKAGIMAMGERIAFGSDTELMYEAADNIAELEAENTTLKGEMNMLKGLLDELIDDIDGNDIGQAKKTLRRYGWG